MVEVHFRPTKPEYLWVGHRHCHVTLLFLMFCFLASKVIVVNLELRTIDLSFSKLLKNANF